MFYNENQNDYAKTVLPSNLKHHFAIAVSVQINRKLIFFQNNAALKQKTHTVLTFINYLLSFIEMVYNNGKSILSTLTSSVGANSTM